MRVVEIDPDIWYRGEGGEESKLLRSDGRMCCVGIEGRDYGVPDGYLFNNALPASCMYQLPRHLSAWAGGWDASLDRTRLSSALVAYLSAIENPQNYLEGAAACINDDPSISDEVRLTYLREVFAQLDIDLRLKEKSQ